MKITQTKPLCEPKNKSDLWKETIEVWDWLVDNGYSPHDFGHCEVAMSYQGFQKAITNTNNCVCVKETKHYRLSAVWIGNIELTFTEPKSNSCKDNWAMECDWEPLDGEPLVPRSR